MSGGFTFPPPPPPPPKPTQQSPGQSGQGYQYNSGPQNSRGRGGSRGRGRGRGQPYGRGHSSSDAPHQHHGSHPNWKAGLSNTILTTETSDYGRQPQDQSWSPGAYVNSGLPSQTYGSPTAPNASSPPRTFAGHKRKLDALKPPNEQTKKHGPPTAPAIPSFGAPVLPVKLQQSARSHSTSQKITTNKPKGKGLGLTPSNHVAPITYSDSEDGEADEEAMYAELGDKLTFEHNGVVMSLKSQADLMAWKKERQKLWPTRARMMEKDEERRRIGEERKRLLGGSGGQARKPKLKQEIENRKVEAAIADPNERAKRLSDLRKKVLESEAKNRETMAQMDQVEATAVSPDIPNDVLDDQPDMMAVSMEDHVITTIDLGAEKELEPTILEASSSEASLDSSSEPDSDDDAPEEISSKPPDAQITSDKKPVCKYFAASGNCRFGDTCHFRHEQSAKARDTQPRFQQDQQSPRQSTQPRRPHVQSSAERKGIFQRFKEQEQEEENRLALQVIKYLGKMGLFNDSHVVGEEESTLVP